MSTNEPDPFSTLRTPQNLRAVGRPEPRREAPKPRPAAVPPAQPAEPPPVKPVAFPDEAGLARVAAKTAAEVCQRFEIGAEAGNLLRAEQTPRQFLALLIEKHHYPDATQFLAHALPRRDGVRWAFLCARQVSGPAPPPRTVAALQATEKWLAEPTEGHRRQAMAAAEKAGYGTPAGSAALAAFWSEGSIAPAHVNPVPPADHLCGVAVAGAVLLAAVATEPEKAPEKFRAFLAQGIDVANRPPKDK